MDDVPINNSHTALAGNVNIVLFLFLIQMILTFRDRVINCYHIALAANIVHFLNMM